MPPPREEHPPLGVSYLYGYDANDTAFPILAVAVNPNRTDYTVPTVGQSTGLSQEHFTKNPNNKFVRVENVSEQRVLWIYKILPGPTIEGLQHDPDSDVFVKTLRTEDWEGAVVEGLAQDGNFVTITEKQPIDAVTAYRVVSKWPKGEFYDADHAQTEYEVLPYEFPGFLYSYGNDGGVTITAPDFFGFSVGVRQSKSLTVPHTIKTWWVIDTTAPSVPYDEITPGTIEINGQTNVVLHDAILRSYGGYAVTIPATVPTFAEYYGTVAAPVAGAPPPDPFAPGTGPKWIGTSRIIRGSVKRAGSKFRFKVQTMSVVMKGV